MVYSWAVGRLTPLVLLEHLVRSRNSHGSLYWRYLRWAVRRREDASELLNRHAQWLIIMQVVVVHAPRSCVAASGLFGPLGDAPLQIVDVADAAKIDVMYKLVQDCDTARPFQSGQDLNRSTDRHARRMKQISDLAASRGMVLTTNFRQAIAFRWCPLVCPGPLAPTEIEENASKTDSCNPGTAHASSTVDGRGDDSARHDLA